MEYGTGAIMAVPAHDERDNEFCTKFALPIPVVVEPVNSRQSPADRPNRPEDPSAKTVGGVPQGSGSFTDYGVLVGSGPYSGLNSEDAIRKMAMDAEKRGFGNKETIFRLRDWGISRQRYWGTPIPVIYCEEDGMVPVPYMDLPVLLPANPKLPSRAVFPSSLWSILTAIMTALGVVFAFRERTRTPGPASPTPNHRPEVQA